MAVCVSICAILVLGYMQHTGLCATGSCDHAGAKIYPTPIIGFMGVSVQLVGFLTNPNDMFFHNDRPRWAGELSYQTHKSEEDEGYVVTIRYPSCTDAGRYCIGGVSFMLEMRPHYGDTYNNDGVLMYSAQTPDVSIPLINTIKISKLEKIGYTKVWDVENQLLDPNCVLVNDKFTGCGDTPEYYLYDVQELPGMDCSTGVIPEPNLPPRLHVLEHIDTRVELPDIEDDLAAILESVRMFDKSANSASMTSTPPLTLPYNKTDNPVGVQDG
ncbi:uncharacterized protein LOC106529065, partial [Austrofundulus limnaeus]|uniref:Uncharacterized protein LOC106529065 n=1 Tax=Austrofundulus limnaeus TaxID=52670 RepID=A0A2I4CIN7_AUSLI